MREELFVVSDGVGAYEVLQRMSFRREILMHGCRIIVTVHHQVHLPALDDGNLRIQRLRHYFAKVALDLLSVRPFLVVW